MAFLNGHDTKIKNITPRSFALLKFLSYKKLSPQNAYVAFLATKEVRVREFISLVALLTKYNLWGYMVIIVT